MKDNSNNVPLVSVIMSVYNGEKDVGNAVDSIVNQTYDRFEFIIINDGSTDKTKEIVEAYRRIDKRIIICDQENVGLTKSLNRAVKIAKGKYIARIDADEIAIKERLEKQVRFLDSHPNIAMVGGYCANIEENSEDKENCYFYPTDYEDIKKGLIKNNMFCHGSIMIRKEVFNTIGLYNERFRYGQDYELWVRVAERFKVSNLPEILLLRRITDNSLSVRSDLLSKIALIHIKIQLSAIRRLDNSPIKYFYLIKNVIYLIYSYPLALIRSISRHISKLREG